MKFLLILVLISFSFQLQANYPFAIKDPYLSSFWGYIAVGSQNIDEDKYPKEILKISLPKYFKEEVEIKLNKQNHLAPLAVFIPGSFGATDRRQPKQITKLLLEKGFHVIRVPNPLSKEYLQFHPTHQLGDFIKSSKGVHQIIQQAYMRLQRVHLVKDEVTLIGVSHGAFIAAVTANINPAHYRKVLLYSPPINLKESMAVVDKTILSNGNRINLSNILTSLADVLWILKFPPKEKELDQKKYIPIAKDLLTFGTFQNRLIGSLKIYFEQNSIDYDFPSLWSGLFSDSYWKWRQKVTFTPLVKKFAPESWKEMTTGQQSDLLYWTEKLEKAGVDTHILSAKNDFINLGLHWSSHPTYLQIIDQGGHYGYRYKDWFVQLFEKQVE